MTSCDCRIEALLSLLIHLCLHQYQGALNSIHNCSSRPTCDQLLQQGHKGADHATHKEHTTILIWSHLIKNLNLND